MKKNISKQSYFLGISLGICISIFVLISFNLLDKSGENNDNLIKENLDLKQQVAILSKEIDNLKNVKEDTQDKQIKEDKEIDKQNIIKIEIKQDMTNDQIADILVEKGVYQHKNDILLIMEILNFNRYEYSKILEESGYITSAYNLNTSLKEIENNQYGVSDALYSKNLVKDKNSFMKLLYILDIRNEVKYGEKEFKKNSSLREVCDVLMN